MAFVSAVLALSFGLSLAGHLAVGEGWRTWSADGLARELQQSAPDAAVFTLHVEGAAALLALLIVALAGGRGLISRDREALALAAVMSLVLVLDVTQVLETWARPGPSPADPAATASSLRRLIAGPPGLGALLLLAASTALTWRRFQQGAWTFAGLGIAVSMVPQTLAQLERLVGSRTALDAAFVLSHAQTLLAYGALLGGLLLAFLASLRQGETVQIYLTRQLEHTGEVLARHNQALAASEAKYHTLLESAHDLIQSVTPEGRFEFVNRSWREALGYRPDEVEQLEVWDVIHPRFHPHCEDILRRALAGESLTRIEVVLVTKSGAEIAVEGTITTRLGAGRPPATLGIFRDISERLRIDRIKGEFISTVSHELRTPLTSIIAALGLLETVHPPAGEAAASQAAGSPERVRELIAVAHRNSRRLLQLINDLLDLQRLAAGKMRFEIRAVPVEAVMKEAVRGMQAFADTLPVRLTLAVAEPGLRVAADEARLIQMLNNLLSNAIKFSPVGGEVVVAAERHGSRVMLSVRDHGPGIPPELQHRLFDQFAQMPPATSRSAGGSGLGLSIVKRLVEAMGGEVSCQSEIGLGATFVLDLPAAQPTEPLLPAGGRPRGEVAFAGPSPGGPS